MLCPQCQHENDIKDKFCSYCGSSLIEEQKLERLKEQSRRMALTDNRRTAHTRSPALFSASLLGLMGWTAFFLGVGCLISGIVMLFQTTSAVISEISPSMPVVGQHTPTNLEIFVKSLTAPTLLRWALWSIFAGMIMLACGDGLKLLVDIRERLSQ